MPNECQHVNRILKQVQNDILVMPNLLRHLLWALDLIWHLNLVI
jgi:hypothetical protein